MKAPIDKKPNVIAIKEQGRQAMSPIEQSVIEMFVPRFVPGGVQVCAGDDKVGHVGFDMLGLSLPEIEPGTDEPMPRFVFHCPERNWLFLIDIPNQSHPFDERRCRELSRLFSGATADLILVAVFPSRAQMTVVEMENIPWGTTIWVVDEPSHLIHFNGERFLGPYASK